MANRRVSKRPKGKAILRLPDLERAKHALLPSLAAASPQESSGHGVDECIAWDCSEPRLAFNRTIILRYRFFLEQKSLAPSTISVRLAAVRQLAYEASAVGFLSPELAELPPAAQFNLRQIGAGRCYLDFYLRWFRRTVADGRTKCAASVRQHQVVQYEFAVSRSESLRLRNRYMNKCRMSRGNYEQKV
jgi:hypothetical protein